VLIERHHEFWLNEQTAFSQAEFAELAGLSEIELTEWVEQGWLLPVDPLERPWRFGADRLIVVRRACRIRRDFELEPEGLALVVQLLDQIQFLERQLRDLKARFPGGLE